MATLSFLGATGTVTGSKFLVEHDGYRLMVDCGLFQGLKKHRLRNWNPPPMEPKELDAIVLSCLAKEPGERPHDAADLAARLAACPVEVPWTEQRRQRWWDVHLPQQNTEPDSPLSSKPRSLVPRSLPASDRQGNAS